MAQKSNNHIHYATHVAYSSPAIYQASYQVPSLQQYYAMARMYSAQPFNLFESSCKPYARLQISTPFIDVFKNKCNVALSTLLKRQNPSIRDKIVDIDWRIVKGTSISSSGVELPDIFYDRSFGPNLSTIIRFSSNGRLQITTTNVKTNKKDREFIGEFDFKGDSLSIRNLIMRDDWLKDPVEKVKIEGAGVQFYKDQLMVSLVRKTSDSRDMSSTEVTCLFCTPIRAPIPKR